MNTRVTDLLGIRVPVIQGAMARIADGKLAGAVSAAGGLGIIACGGARRGERSRRSGTRQGRAARRDEAGGAKGTKKGARGACPLF